MLLLHLIFTCAKQAPSIPKSSNARSIYHEGNDETSLPPWNHSPQIDERGFLKNTYKRTYGDWEFGIEEETESEQSPSEEKKQVNEKPTHLIGGRFQNLDEPVYIRQVPGDGNCLFHSISVSMTFIANGTHVDMNKLPKCSKLRKRRDGHGTKHNKEYVHDLKHLYHHSRHLRLAAVKTLSRNPRKLLFLQGNEYLRAKDLVSAAAAQYGMTAKEYCNQMKRDSKLLCFILCKTRSMNSHHYSMLGYWGGGPELVALSNYLKRPIHVYELCDSWRKEEANDEKDSDNNDDSMESKEDGEEQQNENDNNEEEPLEHLSIGDLKSRIKDCNENFRLKRMACFGSPKFDKKQALHILSADSRFPDVKPGQQAAAGNHFLAIFPASLLNSIDPQKKKSTSPAVRGGDIHVSHRSLKSRQCDYEEEAECNLLTSYFFRYTEPLWNFIRRLKLVFS